MMALRFNFRGVGKSQGQQTDGRMEPLDLAGAIDAALAQPGINPAKVCVIGHGFGAYIALMYAPLTRVFAQLWPLACYFIVRPADFPKPLNAPNCLYRRI